ncbi:LuxR C-terminal-related transcriptional regulator [Phenylobacterium sp.]|uniref:LuxR C-terminal-related transcriptional regulator n=1 Tax=Phenylobacterium sp. TaxID=1871053 RepID=UPI0025DCDD3E|nr:LuxR C-terminal-related transcriptional regulator [Phenylobacterium sp.]
MSLASPVRADASVALVAILDPDDAATLAKLREILPAGALRRMRLPDGFEPAPPPVRLTQRQAAILPLLLGDLSNKEIARRLAISHFTVRNHVSQILRALDVPTRQAAKAALVEAHTPDPASR